MKQDLCFETIRIEDGKPSNLLYHQKRFEQTQKELYNTHNHPLLFDIIKAPTNGLLRCKIIYNNKIREITYTPYTFTLPAHFKLMQSDINYPYKYIDRDVLDQLKLASKSEEILIIKNGLLTDTSIANIALLIGGEWLTPQTPLLHGTIREKLLHEGKIKTSLLVEEDLYRCDSFALMNAMVGFAITNQFSFGGFYDV